MKNKAPNLFYIVTLLSGEIGSYLKYNKIYIIAVKITCTNLILKVLGFLVKLLKDLFDNSLNCLKKPGLF